MYIKSVKIYHILRFTTQVLLPALATLYITIAKTWGLPYSFEVSTTLMAVDTFLGAILEYSNKNYKDINNLDWK